MVIAYPACVRSRFHPHYHKRKDITTNLLVDKEQTLPRAAGGGREGGDGNHHNAQLLPALPRQPWGTKYHLVPLSPPRQSLPSHTPHQLTPEDAGSMSPTHTPRTASRNKDEPTRNFHQEALSSKTLSAVRENGGLVTNNITASHMDKDFPQ